VSDDTPGETPEHPRDAARRYFKRELAMGRSRVLVPIAPVTAAPDATTAAVTAAAVPAPADARPSAPVSTFAKESPVTTPSPPPSKAANPENQPLPPFTALRSDEFAARLAEALIQPGAEAAGCTACELAQTRNTVVFGTGSGRSGIVFIGEAPGANEDEQGVPFVGRAGQLLDRILAAIGIQREDVYICNVLKCRPPSNRDPKPEEAAACAHFLRAQLDALQPRVLCALGLHATRWLLPSKLPMAKLRGQVLDYNGIPTLATYHPAALLRNPGLKPKAWEDFKLLRTVAEEAASGEVESGGA
jgi:DNA polymerase